MYYKDIFFDHETAGDMDKTVTLLIEKSYRSDFFCFGVGFFAVSDLGRLVRKFVQSLDGILHIYSIFIHPSSSYDLYLMTN